jgi:hypothetical protein
MSIGKNASKSEIKLVPYTAVELLRMSSEQMRALIFGKGGGRIPRPGVQEEISRIINEWRKS